MRLANFDSRNLSAENADLISRVRCVEQRRQADCIRRVDFSPLVFDVAGGLKSTLRDDVPAATISAAPLTAAEQSLKSSLARKPGCSDSRAFAPGSVAQLV